jgi:hypothetical protein
MKNRKKLGLRPDKPPPILTKVASSQQSKTWILTKIASTSRQGLKAKTKIQKQTATT